MHEENGTFAAAAAAQLQAHLQNQLYPSLKDSEAFTQALRDQQAMLHERLDMFASARLTAAKNVGRLTKNQFAEIRNLMVNPPDPCKRTLVAIWFLLHCDRYQGQQVRVTFDETRDWWRCQRLLTDKDFSMRILEFHPDTLEASPQIPLHIAQNIFNISDSSEELHFPKGFVHPRERGADAPQQGAALKSAKALSNSSTSPAPNSFQQGAACLLGSNSSAALPKAGDSANAVFQQSLLRTVSVGHVLPKACSSQTATLQQSLALNGPVGSRSFKSPRLAATSHARPSSGDLRRDPTHNNTAAFSAHRVGFQLPPMSPTAYSSDMNLSLRPTPCSLSGQIGSRSTVPHSTATRPANHEVVISKQPGSRPSSSSKSHKSIPTVVTAGCSILSKELFPLMSDPTSVATEPLSNVAYGRSIPQSPVGLRSTSAYGRSTPPTPSSPSNAVPIGLRRSSASCSRQPLTFEDVSHANKTCGVLAKWIIELLKERNGRSQILEESVILEEKLKAAQACEHELQAKVAEAEKKLLAAQACEHELQAKVAEAEKKLVKMRVSLRSEEGPANPLVLNVAKARQCPPLKVSVGLTVEKYYLEHHLSHLHVLFGRDNDDFATYSDLPSESVCGSGSGSLERIPAPLLKIKEILTSHMNERFPLKLLIEGHRDHEESEGLDDRRAEAVYNWFVSDAGITPALMRMEGRGSSGSPVGAAAGACRRYVAFVVIPEIVVKSCSNEELEKCGPLGLSFCQHQSILSLNAEVILAEVARWLGTEEARWLGTEERLIGRIKVEGHCDCDEQLEGDASLGMLRAEVVRDNLVSLGVATGRLLLKNCGARHPVSQTNPDRNRRVELHLE